MMARNEDAEQHSFRLNLTNPNHLEVHNTLKNLNKEIHRSKNNFIVESILRNIRNYKKEDLFGLEDDEIAYVTKEDLIDLKVQIKEEVMKEVITLLCGSLAGRTLLPAIPVQTIETNNKKQEENKVEEDGTLNAMADEWS